MHARDRGLGLGSYHDPLQSNLHAVQYEQSELERPGFVVGPGLTPPAPTRFCVGWIIQSGMLISNCAITDFKGGSASQDASSRCKAEKGVLGRWRCVRGGAPRRK